MSKAPDEHYQFSSAWHYPEGVTTLRGYDDLLHNLRFADTVFRGENQYFDFYARPSLFRTERSDWPRRFESKMTKAEYREIRRCQLRRPWDLFRFGLEGPEWLSMTQHYRGRTRLLDVTFNAEHALFFACWTSNSPPDCTKDGWVYAFIQYNFRRQTVPRSEVRKGDAEQGISSSFGDMFDASPVSRVYENVGVLYAPKEDRAFNRRMGAQNGAFLWWEPPYKKCPAQVIPLCVSGGAKDKILSELDSRGVSEEVLFPDRFGREQAKSRRSTR